MVYPPESRRVDPNKSMILRLDDVDQQSLVSAGFAVVSAEKTYHLGTPGFHLCVGDEPPTFGKFPMVASFSAANDAVILATKQVNQISYL